MRAYFGWVFFNTCDFGAFVSPISMWVNMISEVCVCVGGDGVCGCMVMFIIIISIIVLIITVFLFSTYDFKNV